MIGISSFLRQTDARVGNADIYCRLPHMTQIVLELFNRA